MLVKKLTLKFSCESYFLEVKTTYIRSIGLLLVLHLPQGVKHIFSILGEVAFIFFEKIKARFVTPCPWKSCDLDGENKTKITDWIYLDFDEVYLMYSKDYIIENYIENED